MPLAHVARGQAASSDTINAIIDLLQGSQSTAGGWDYAIWSPDGVNVYGTNEVTKENEFTGTDWVAIANSIVAVVGAELIFVHPDVPPSTSTLTVNKSNVTIFCPKVNLKQQSGPYGRKVVIGGNATAQVRRTWIHGIQMDELQVDAPSLSFDVDGFVVQYCSTNSYQAVGRQGVRYTGPGDIENGLFLMVSMRAQEANVNMITVEASSDANGHISHYRCHLDNVAGLTGVDSIEYTGLGHTGTPMNFTDCSFVHIGGTPTGCSIVRTAGTTLDTGPRYLTQTNCHYEIHQADMDLVQIASPAAFMYFSVVIDKPDVVVGAHTYRWIVNNNVGQMHKGSCLQVSGGRLSGTDPISFTRGTTNESANFTVSIKDVGRFNPSVSLEPYDFLVFTSAGTTYAVSGDGATIYSSATPATVVQSAIEALPAVGGEILIHTSVAQTNGDVTIAGKNGVSLVGMGAPDGSGTNQQPALEKVYLDASAADITGGRIAGIQLRMVDFNATTGRIRNFSVADVGMRIDGSTNRKGFVFRGTNDIRHVTLHNVHGRLTAAGCSLVDFQNSSAATGDINFTGRTVLDTDSTASGGIAVKLSADCRAGSGGPVTFENLDVEDSSTSGGMAVVAQAGMTVADRGLYAMVLGRLSFSQAVAGLTHTLFTIAASSATTRFGLVVQELVLNENATGTVNLVANSNTNWLSRPQGLTVLHGTRLGSGTVQLGTPNLHTNFRVDLGDLQGITPSGLITNPFATAASQNFIAPGGSVATPTTATAYVVGVRDTLVTSTGGTVSDIAVKDPAGNVVKSGVTTLDHERIPRGYSVTWTHTGAPTVSAFGV